MYCEFLNDSFIELITALSQLKLDSTKIYIRLDFTLINNAEFLRKSDKIQKVLCREEVSNIYYSTSQTPGIEVNTLLSYANSAVLDGSH